MTPEIDLDATARGAFPDGVPWRRYVAMGDSIAEGVGDPVPGYPDGGWPSMVARSLTALRPDLAFHNLGQRYLTTRQIRERQLERALELEPDLVTVAAGGNDMLIQKFDAALTEHELDAMVAALRGAGVHVFTITLYDIFAASGVMPQEATDYLRPRFEALCDAVRSVAARHELPMFDFARCDLSADRTIYSSDLQHANQRGHALAADLVLRALGDYAATLRAAA